MNICELFLSAAQRYPDHIALIEGKRSITYAELEKTVRATTVYFRQKGIGQGDRVLVFVPMSIDLYRVVLALFYLGATAVFLDEWVSIKRMELCCRLAVCKGFIGITKARILAWFSSELMRIPVKLSLRGKSTGHVDLETVTNDDSALITFTTGSTGTPKAALRTHGFLKAQFDALIDEIAPHVEDVDMPVLPIVLFVNLGVGCTSVIADFKASMPERMKPATIMGQLQRQKVNRITASPFFIRRLSDYAIDRGVTLPGIQKIFTGGAPVFPAEADLYMKAFPAAKSIIVYGSTEAEPISSIGAQALVERRYEQADGLLVGRPYRKAEVRIIQITDAPIPFQDEHEFQKLTLPDGEIGEIVVSGPHVLKQYFNNEDAFVRNKVVAGDTIWHRTGDSGYLQNGDLYLCGRCKQLIYREGRVIAPFIVESQLQNLPGVTMGTVINRNNIIHLIVKTKLDIDEVLPLVQDLVYDQLHLVKSIPRDPRHHSKIDYIRLGEMIE